MTSTWLQKQRKGDLIELCGVLGITNYDGLKKSEVEALIDKFLMANDLRDEPFVAGFYSARDRILSSPVKKETDAGTRPSRRRTGLSQTLEAEPSPAKRRSVQPSARPSVQPSVRPSIPPASARPSVQPPVVLGRDFATPLPPSTHQSNGIKVEADQETASDQEWDDGSPERETTHEPADPESRDHTYSLETEQAVVGIDPSRHATPATNMPASPAVLAKAVDNEVVAVRARVSDLVRWTGVHDQTDMVRSALSTVHSVLLVVAGFELWQMRPALLPAKHAFTVPAQEWLGMNTDMPISLPDVFLLLTASFWSPFLTWALTSFIAPTLAGYFVNLTATRASLDSSSRRAPRYTIDPLAFSIAKAIMSYVVYGKGVTFDGWLSEESIQRLVDALYGGTSGIFVGTSVTALMSVYDAILRK